MNNESTKSYSSIPEILKLYPKLIDTSVSSFKSSISLHPNLYWERWEQSYQTAKSTLEYIDRLKTKVYILIIENNRYKDFIQFNPLGTPKELTRYLKNLNKNIKWSEKEKKYIQSIEWKFMSCILQKDKDSTELKIGKFGLNDSKIPKHTYHKLLERILKDKILPNGMYIYSLRDVLLVHKDDIYPWIDVIGSKLKMKNFPKKFLPIFNTTGGNDYWDIPIPNFEDKDFIYGKKPELDYSVDKTEESQIQIIWNKKKPTAVFRGGSAGCGYDEYTNPRIKISKMSQILQDKNNSLEYQTLLDAGITTKSLSEKYRFHRDTGLGYFDFKKLGLKEVNRLNKIEQSYYKYIVYIEGNVSAHRLATDMLMGSVILYVESEYSLWFEFLMKENVHFIKIKSDLSDLIDKIIWCRDNDDICKTIAENGRKLALEILKPERFYSTFIDYINFFN